MREIKEKISLLADQSILAIFEVPNKVYEKNIIVHSRASN